jgi:hypothetical protein
LKTAKGDVDFKIGFPAAFNIYKKNTFRFLLLEFEF